jgi:DNA-binding response OmpR family regulator
VNQGRVLIVENYSDLLMLIGETMRQRHYRCDAVHDADEALTKLKSGEEYASILLDVTWPVTTNPVIRYLRSERPDELRKVIVMTAFDPHYLGLDELQEICTFLKKPFGIDELFARLAHCAP